MVLYIIVSLAAPICLVVIVINCLNCFSRKKAAFTSFENTVQSSNVQHNEAFTMEIPEESSPTAAVVIEPLPDILAKTSAMPSLRPRIICTDRSKQESMLISLQRSFPRDQLVYLNEIGEGWFGQAIESEALNTSGGKPRRSVVVKRLKDDASKFEQKQFLDEVTAFRCLEHPNLLGFVGQCTEVSPYLTILEAAPHGNLKTFLLNNKHEADRLVKNNSLVNFSLDIAAGLACLHRNDYVHNDIASRNCLLMDDMSVKIGDYGISDTLFKEDYCNTGQEMLPIRWMAPETLIQAGDIWTLQQSDSISDMWSFGILLWELFSLGERPYDMLTDEAVLQGVVLDRLIVPSEIEIKMPSKDYVNSVMQQCWKHPSERLEIEQAYQQLEVLARQRVQTIDAISDFDHKWSHLMPNSKASRTSSADSEAGSRTALAGSFETNNSSSPDDKSTVLTSSETNITGVAAAAKSVEPTVTKTKIKVAADMDSDSSNLVVKTKSDLQSAKADLPGKSEHESPAIITNGVAKVEPLLEPSITPVKSSSMEVQGMLTSTPLTQNQNSVSQLYSPDASKSSEYVTANETPEAPNINSNQLSSLGMEFSLDSNDMSFHEFEETIQEDTAERNTNGSEGKNTAASTDNQNDKYSRDSALDNSNNNGTSDQFEPAVEQGSTLFGEFVRTSPTSPRVDFTDFVVSQDSDNIKDNIPVATDHVKEDTTIKAFAAEDITLYPSASPKQLLDVSMSDTWDMNTGSITSDSLNIAENDILNLSAPQSSIIVNDHPILDTPMSSSSSQQDLAQTVTGQNDFSIPKNVFTKEEDGSNQVQLGLSDIHVDIGSFPLSESIEDIVETGDVPAKTSNEQVDNAINVELMDAGIEPAPPNSWMDSEPPTHDEAPSLPSKSENFFVIDTTEQPVNETAFSDLHDQMDDFEFLEPLKPEVPSISAALEDNKNELLLALEDNSNGFSFVQSSDQNPTISSGDQDMLLLGDDFSTIVVPQKVGTPSKNESASQSNESGIHIHSVTENSSNHAAHHNTSYSCCSDLHSESEGIDAESLPSQGFSQQTPFKISPPPSPFSSNLYRSRYISLSPDRGDPDALLDDQTCSCAQPCSQSIENACALQRTSPTADSDSEACSSSNNSSSNSESGREYICNEPMYDLDQLLRSSSPDPAALPTSDTSGPSSVDVTSPSVIDFDEQALKIACELYLSKGVNSSRVYQISPLQTIPEHQVMPSEADLNPPPSDTSSVEGKYEDLFGSDGFEWDDFYGDPLLGKEVGISHQVQDQSRLHDVDISFWSLDMDSESVQSPSSVLSSLSEDSLYNRTTLSEVSRNTVADSEKSVHCVSNSEIMFPSSQKVHTAQGMVLVTDILSQVSPGYTSSSRPNSGKSNFYSLTENYEVETDSASDGPISPEAQDLLQYESHSSTSPLSSALSLSVNSTSSAPLSPPPSLPVVQISRMHRDLYDDVLADPSMGSGLSHEETHDDTVESTPSDRIVDLPGLLSTTSSDESGVDGQPKASDVNESAANPPQSVQDGQLIDF